MGAEFSTDRLHRYRLWRLWDESLPLCQWICLNPSTGNYEKNDPTIRRIIGFSKKFGFGGVYITNLFSFVTSKPAELRPFIQKDEQNITALKETAQKCAEIIFGWGAFQVFGMDKEIVTLFPAGMCLGKNANGSPKHPLFLKNDSELIKF